MTDTDISCACGHYAEQHQDGGGRCTGRSYDDNYETEYACVCPFYTEEKL